MPGAEKDWYQAEPSLGRQWVIELQRLKRRALARPWIIFALAALVTGLLMVSVIRKPRLARARVVIAVTENALMSGRTSSSMTELRDYVATVLLPNAKLLPIVEEHAAMFPLRRRFGDAYALSELRDVFEIEVWRNYFLYQYSIDEPRSARIAVTVQHKDPDFAIGLARRLANIIIDGEAERRRATGAMLAAEAEHAITRARKHALDVERELNARAVEQAEATIKRDRGKSAALRMEVASLSEELRDAQSKLDAVTAAGDVDQLDAAYTAAGLGLGMEIADERLPPPEQGSLPLKLVIIGIVLFLLAWPATAIVIGTFDSRIHELDDVTRLGLPIVGHVPSFPGDGAGSLRDRGVRRRRVPSF